jgi:hypothetical protein
MRALTLAVAAGLAVLSAGTAHATSDASAAEQVAAAPDTTARLSAFFVNLDRHTAGKLAAGAPDAQALRAVAPHVTGHAQAVYTLSPSFVRSGSGDVASFAYMAVPARSASGQEASIQLAHRGDTWVVHQITSAGPPAVGGTVFTEPQVDAWYRVDGDRVVPLNDSAVASVGEAGVGLARYQEIVHGRYADKLPGSEYQRQHMLGGYETPPPAEDHTVAAVLLVLVGVGVAGAGAVSVRRRRA